MYRHTNAVNLNNPGREQQEMYNRQHYEQEKAQERLRSIVRSAIEDGADGFEDLQDDELRCMTAAAIRAADPEQAWQFIAGAPGVDSYPGLVADALDRKYGGFLGLERTGDRLVRAILSGAVRYTQGIIKQVFNEELNKRRVPHRGTVGAGF
jgi:hypothetical protein